MSSETTAAVKNFVSLTRQVFLRNHLTGISACGEAVCATVDTALGAVIVAASGRATKGTIAKGDNGHGAAKLPPRRGSVHVVTLKEMPIPKDPGQGEPSRRHRFGSPARAIAEYRTETRSRRRLRVRVRVRRGRRRRRTRERGVRATAGWGCTDRKRVGNDSGARRHFGGYITSGFTQRVR